METISYYDQDSNIQSIEIPSNVQTLRKSFPRYNIKLAQNNSTLLAYFNNKEVNIFDLNALVQRTNTLNHNERKTLMGVLQTYKPQTINSVFNIIKNIDNFVLITDYEEFYTTEKLGRKLYETRNPNPLNRKQLQTDEYIKLGLDAKLSKKIYTSTYGWIIEEKPIEIVQLSSEVYQDEGKNDKKLLDVTLTNPQTLAYTKVSFPISKAALHQLLGRIELNHFDECLVHYRANEIELNLFREMNSLFYKVTVDMLNEITNELKYMNQKQSQSLAGVISILKPQDIDSYYHVIDSLDSFELVDIDINMPSEYAHYG